MQSVSSRVWTRVAVSISYDDDHYTMGIIIIIVINRLRIFYTSVNQLSSTGVWV